MGMSYHLSDGVIRFVTAGDVVFRRGIDVLREALTAAAAAPPPGGWHLSFDIRASTENRPADDLRGVAQLLNAYRPILSARCVVVAADPLHYGLGRMFAAYMDTLDLTTAVFYDPADADRWLRQPPAD
jgi:hypothetical protein